jgi:hypothetical protein
MSGLRIGDEAMHPWTLYALEVARDRERELQYDWLAAEVRAGQPPRPSRLRRPVALVLAGLSRGTAAAVRRLDDCVADDLGRALAPAE